MECMPTSAPLYIQKIVKTVLSKKGGEGVFREFVENLLQANDVLNNCLDIYEKKDKTEKWQ